MIPEHISVVIVENQPIMRTALSTAVSAEGMDVLAEVADSRQALQVTSKLTPDLILYSVGEPSLKDFEHIFALRQGFPYLSIVALITGEFEWHFQAALNYGAHLVLTKSTPRSELINSIKNMLSRKIYPASAQVN